LLGELLLDAHIPDAKRYYGIVVVVVVFSVLVQGSLTPAAAHVLRIPMRPVEQEPWALSVGLRDEPQGVHRCTVAPGAAAAGRVVADLPGLPEDAWISVVVRDGALVNVRGTTVLEPGDEVVVLSDDEPGLIRTVFEAAR
jgi:cell volume regulation protein A